MKFYDLREVVIQFLKDYYEIINNVIYNTKYGEGLKILTPKQMPERLPIVLAQVKAVNASSNLLNEIHKIIYYFYRAKEITKKYTKI